MKERKVYVEDFKSKRDWDTQYSSVSMEEYIKTLEYDESTPFIEDCLNGIDRDARVLDLGCGAGRHSVHLMQKLGFKNVYSLDLSTEGLKKLKDYCSEANVVQGNAVYFPFKDNTVDVVLMVGIVYEIPQRKLHPLLFREIHRVLVSGGQFIFVNNAFYNLGERIYDLTQKFEMIKHGAKNYRFYMWRYTRKDVRDSLIQKEFSITKEFPCHQYRGAYKFLYGIFVPAQVKNARKQRLESTSYATYTVHELYLVSKHPELLSLPGRVLAAYSKKLFPFALATTVCYEAVKR